MMPFVSVLMPVYNAAQTLENTVGSIRRQTMPDWELILVDDASTDESAALCTRLAAEDERIYAILLEENGGAGPARNLALSRARGEYVVTVDSDDVIEPDLFEQARRALEQAGAHTVVWGLTEDYVGPNGMTHSIPVAPRAAVCHTVSEVHRELLWLEEHTLFGYCCNKMYRRDVLEAHGITSPNEPLYEDFLFNAAYAPYITSLVTLPSAPYHYLKRDGSLTSRFVPRYYELSERRVQVMWDLCREWGMEDEDTRRVLGGIYMRYIFSALQRNCDPRMGMTAATRRAFVGGLYEKPLFSELVPHAQPSGRAMRVLGALLKRRCTTLCLVAGRALYCVQKQLPGLFSRAAADNREGENT